MFLFDERSRLVVLWVAGCGLRVADKVVVDCRCVAAFCVMYVGWNATKIRVWLALPRPNMNPCPRTKHFDSDSYSKIPFRSKIDIPIFNTDRLINVSTANVIVQCLIVARYMLAGSKRENKFTPTSFSRG